MVARHETDIVKSSSRSRVRSEKGTYPEETLKKNFNELYTYRSMSRPLRSIDSIRHFELFCRVHGKTIVE